MADEVIPVTETVTPDVTSETPATSPAVKPDDIEAMKAALKKANSEAAANRKKLEAYEKSEADRKTAEMTELQKSQELIKQLETERDTAKQQADQALIRVAFESAARAANWSHPELAIRFPYEADAISIGKDGEVTGVDEVIKALTKKYPDQVKRADDSNADIDGKKRSDKTQPDPKAHQAELAKRYRLPLRS